MIKGIFVLDGDELRLCLGEVGKDRPAAFPERPKPGEVLVLQRVSSGATPLTAKAAQPEQMLLTPEEAMKQRPKEQVTVQFKVVSAELTSHFAGSDLLAIQKLNSRTGTSSPSCSGDRSETRSFGLASSRPSILTASSFE